MDPVTGIGLAASVIQLVTFGISAAKTCREIYEQGVLGDHSQVDHVATHLASLTVSIQQSLRNSNTQSLVLSKEERELVDLCRKCEDCALKLQHELRKLQTKRTSIVLAASKAARALWKKNTIEQIQKQLENYRSTLEISLLSRLSQRFDAQGLKSDERFASLDKSLQHMIACLAKSETTLATISIHEAEQTRQHTAAQIGRLERLHVDDRRFEEVTRSLFYPEIFSRQEQIENVFDGIQSSYDWIFDKPRIHKIHRSNQANPHTQAPLWDDFACWLKSGHGVYWINGKAGSGKSTLMNHICSHNRRLELLQEWSSDRRLLTPSFFFWNSGSRQQKTIDGLLRSLIYQMLNDCRQLITCFEDTPIHAWTESRLLTFLFTLLQQTQVDVAICIFIDGLDEFDGQYDNVIRMITNLSDQRHVKICVSSRPLLAFEMAFKNKPSLRLQDLTFETIREYTKKQLSPLVQQYATPNGEAQQRAERLLDTIVKRADGVFLWAVIATGEVRDGLQGMVNLDELAQAIEVLPPELEDLFMLILKRIKLAFRRDAAKFLQIVLFMSDDDDDGDYLDLCRLHLISSQQESQDAPFVYQNFPMSELTEACHTLQTRVLSHTAGLLELTPRTQGPPLNPCKRKDWDPIAFTKVDFIHRTVRDFLIDNHEAKSFLSDYGLSEAQVYLCMARGTLAHLVQHSQGDAVTYQHWPHPMLYTFGHVLRHVSIAERLSGCAQSKFVQSLDYAPLVGGDTIAEEHTTHHGPYRPYRKTVIGTLIDIVGMAAATGMTIYVCEQLGLPVSSAGYYPRLPDLEEYSTSRTAPRKLAWKMVDQLPDTTPRRETLFNSSIYRQALGKCLQWDESTQVNSLPDDQTENHPLAETYILCCCEPISIDLVRILLKAGANPMVRVLPMDPAPYPGLVSDPGFLEGCSFWDSWLILLREMRNNYKDAHGKSRGLLFGKRHLNRRVTLSDIFDVTKALLAHGVDINHKVPNYYGRSESFLKRRGLANGRLGPRLELSCSAMFLLEECFSKEPEFRKFAVAVRPLIKTPTRRIEYLYRGLGNRFPSVHESKLWPLIEKWESTGHEEDRIALVTAMKQVWKVLDSDKEFEGESEEESEEESGEELEEESEEESKEAREMIRKGSKEKSKKENSEEKMEVEPNEKFKEQTEELI